jgi:hypothetical protein
MEENHQKIAEKPEEKNDPSSNATDDRVEPWNGVLHIDPLTVQDILDANDVVEEWQNEQS